MFVDNKFFVEPFSSLFYWAQAFFKLSLVMPMSIHLINWAKKFVQAWFG